MTEFREAHKQATKFAMTQPLVRGAPPGTSFLHYLRAMESQGYRLLPVEATGTMMQAAFEEGNRQGFALDEMSPDIYFKPLFRAMAEAHPTVDAMLGEST